MAEENKKSGLQTVGVAPTADQQADAQKSMADRLHAGQAEEVERNRIAGVNSKLTTKEHLGNRPDEPDKPQAMESTKVGKALPTDGDSGDKVPESRLDLIPIDPAGKGTPTDIVVPAGLAAGHGLFAENSDATAPTPSPDQDGTIQAVRDSGTSVKKIEGDPSLQESKDLHAGENAVQQAGLPAGVGRGGGGLPEGERPADQEQF